MNPQEYTLLMNWTLSFQMRQHLLISSCKWVSDLPFSTASASTGLSDFFSLRRSGAHCFCGSEEFIKAKVFCASSKSYHLNVDKKYYACTQYHLFFLAAITFLLQRCPTAFKLMWRALTPCSSNITSILSIRGTRQLTKVSGSFWASQHLMT